MNAASDWYRDGIGTPVDNVQAMRWLLPLTAKLNIDAVHKAHQLGELMTDEQSARQDGSPDTPSRQKPRSPRSKKHGSASNPKMLQQPLDHDGIKPHRPMLTR